MTTIQVEVLKSEREPAWGRWMFGVGLAVTLVLAFIAGAQYWLVKTFVETTPNEAVTKFGISGDFFGFSNAFFSAMAFAMIIVTLWMQKYELKQQRLELDQTQKIMELQIKEMELQRQEMQEQRREMQDQNESIRRQRFESTFFGMLDLHKQVVSEIASTSGKKRGREAFEELARSLDPRLAMLGDEYNRRVEERTLEQQIADYELWYDDNEHHVGHYFRTLYNIIKHIDAWGGTDKSTYTRLVRAQLSRGELELMLYNGLSSYGREKFKPLIEIYGLLKHAKATSGNAVIRAAYNMSAFGVQTTKESA